MKEKRSKTGEEITNWEFSLLKVNKCPNCLVSDEIYAGPEGGGSTNFRCHACGQGYNIGVFVKNIGVDPHWIDIKKIRKKKLNKICMISVLDNYKIGIPSEPFDRQKVIDIIFDNFAYKFNSIQVRNEMICMLNMKFFPDKIAEFVDVTTDEEIDSGEISILIRYKGKLYNLLAFEHMYIKVERLRKLTKILRYGK